MRFTYIDGKGNEVALDSVEALAARVELGAVTSSTELYDASTETWGPADTHEVYRQLLAEAAARDFGATNGGGAPAFEVPAAQAPATGGSRDGDATDPPQVDVMELAPTDPADAADTSAVATPGGATDAESGPPEDAESVLDLELSIDMTHASPIKPAVEESDDPDPETSFADLEGSVDPDPETSFADLHSPTETEPSLDDGGDGSEEPSFELSGDLELEEAPSDVPHNEAAADRQPPMDGFSASASDAWDQEMPNAGADDDSHEDAEYAVPGATGGLEAEPLPDNPWGTPSEPEHPFDEPSDPFGAGHWVGPDGTWPDASLVDDEDETPARKILQLLTSPGVQWGFLAGSFLVMAFFGSAVVQGLLLRGLITVAGVLVFGFLTGAFLWRDPENRTLIPAATFGLVAVASVPLFMLGSRADAANAPVQQRTVSSSSVRSAPSLADVPAANPGERAMEGRAVEEVIEGMDSLAVSYGLDRRPADWLQGVYLANASDFPQVEEYWRRYGGYLEEIRTQDAEWFRDSYERRLLAAGISRAAVPGLLERGLARFQASASRREALYDSMEELVMGALELHALLLEHEGSIDYQPWNEGGLSEDPVVEAVVRDPAVEDRMWSLIAGIAFTLEQVTDLGQTSPAHLQAALLDSMRSSVR